MTHHNTVYQAPSRAGVPVTRGGGALRSARPLPRKFSMEKMLQTLELRSAYGRPPKTRIWKNGAVSFSFFLLSFVFLFMFLLNTTYLYAFKLRNTSHTLLIFFIFCSFFKYNIRIAAVRLGSVRFGSVCISTVCAVRKKKGSCGSRGSQENQLARFARLAVRKCRSSLLTVYFSLSLSLPLSLSLYIYIYIYMLICISHIYIYIHTHL